jgi:hypothetical protein
MKNPTSVAAMVLVLWSFALTGLALADERVEGIVLRTKVTHCDVTKPGAAPGR